MNSLTYVIWHCKYYLFAKMIQQSVLIILLVLHALCWQLSIIQLFNFHFIYVDSTVSHVSKVHTIIIITLSMYIASKICHINWWLLIYICKQRLTIVNK